MRILITGGCGFLGHHLVEHLLKNSDASIVVLDRLNYASSGFDRLRDIKAFDDKRVQVLTADLSHPISEGIRRELGAFDYMVHAAAETHVDNSIVDPLPFLQANVIGTHHALLLAKSAGVRRVFLVSTDEVYGPAPVAVNYTEDDRFRPTNPYAAAKAGAECVAFAYANTFGIPVTILTAMNFFGERQHPEKFIPKVIRQVIAGETVIIHSDPTRTIPGSRFYLHCRSFSDALLHLIRKETFPDKLHVSGDQEVSNLEMAQMIAGVVGKRLRYELVDFHSSRPGHDLRYALNANRLRDLGWKNPITVEQSLARTVEWYTNPSNRQWLDWSGK